MVRSRVVLAGLLAIGAAAQPAAAARPPASATTLVSMGTDGAAGNSSSVMPALSGDGRFVAFTSAASNLVSSDTTGVFVRDMGRGAISVVSVAADGAPQNFGSFNPTLSRDGRFVAFDSNASNLVAGDTNRATDVFVRDRRRDVLRRVSVATDGAQADGFSYKGAISPDGRYVAFQSSAANLVRGDANEAFDVFVRDLRTGRVRLASRASDGAQGNDVSEDPSVSARGRRVAFVSFA